jgi:hypothetical protein
VEKVAAAVRWVTMRTIFCAFLGLALASCGGPDPVANEANNAAVAGNVDVDVLPPDESAATPAGELANGAQNVDNVSNEADGNIVYNQTP